MQFNRCLPIQSSKFQVFVFVEIDEGSGFCFGVTTAIRKAEEELAKEDNLYCLGDIVHNGRECERLKNLGLISVEYSQMEQLHDAKILFRAHGEPPTTYQKAQENHLTVIDATCPVVLNLQRRIKREYDEDIQHLTQIVIYGKNGHAEVIGLVGQTEGNAIVIENKEDISKLDFTKNISLYSQTTKSLEGFKEIVELIKQRMNAYSEVGKNEFHNPDGLVFKFFDTICRQVANRISDIRHFAERHDVIIFVAGVKSSNGRVLFGECCKVNKQSYLVGRPEEIQPEWFEDADSVGICGATSTPKWLMEQCKAFINKIRN